jgi:hypothetical protein
VETGRERAVFWSSPFGDESRWAIDLGCRIYLSRVIRGAVARTPITRSRQTAADHRASFASVMLILGFTTPNVKNRTLRISRVRWDPRRPR